MKNLLCLVLSCLCLLVSQVADARTYTLAPVVVTATRTPRHLDQIASSVSVITARQIADSGATSLAEVLQDVAGVSVVDEGPAGSLASPSIRGSEPAQVLVLLDGVRLNSPQNGQFNLSDLPVPLSEIERIEVLRGPASTLYGSNALGGVIQIITRRPEAAPLTRLSWREGRFDTRDLGFSTTGRKGPLGYRFSASRRHSDGYRPNSDLSQNDLNGLLRFALPGDMDLEVSAYHLQKKLGVPGSVALPSPQARQQDENTFVGATLKGPVGPVAIRARLSYDRLDNRYRDPGAYVPSDDRHLAQTRGGELQGSWTGGLETLTVGGNVYRDTLDSTVVGKIGENRWALFGQSETRLSPRWSLLFGLRYDAHENFRNELSPRAGLRVQLTPATTLRASVGRAYRAPSFNDRYWPDEGFDKGNPDLRPETAWEYELALDQKLGQWGRVSVDGFRRDARDLITWQPDAGGVWIPVNVGKARIWGVESSVVVTPATFVEVGGNYTYLHPQDLTTGDFLAGKPRHQAGAYLQLTPARHTRLRLDGRYACYYPQPDQRSDSFTTVDVALTRTFEVAGVTDLELTLAVKNLFNQDYEINPGYPMPPREWQLGLAAYF